MTLAFTGDVHFEQALKGPVQRPGSDLGAIFRTLRDADVAMVSLESALASRNTPTSRELEDPERRYWFRTDLPALGVLARSGIDVVSLADHGADHGRPGLRESLAAAARARPAVVGIGRGARQAYRPHRVSMRGTEVVAETGVLTLELHDGVVVGDRWTPARIPAEGGVPRRPLAGRARDEATV